MKATTDLLPGVNRRGFLKHSATALAAGLSTRLFGAEGASPARSGLGLVTYCQGIERAARQQETGEDLFEPLNFIKHAHSLGAGGVQVGLGTRNEADATALRRYAEEHGLWIEAIVSLPETTSGLQRLDAELRTARQAGALAARTTVFSGRRYEVFDTLEEFRARAALAQRLLERSAPLAEKHRMPLAVENHKDQRNDERIALLEAISSEYVGACLDTGNSVALLEDPQETIERFAPWAVAVHLKDQGLASYQDGFLLGDVPLGAGAFDLPQMAATIRRHKPQMRFALELITRDPLEVPCLTEHYWATMPDVPATELARMLRLVQSRGAERLPTISDLDPAGRRARELSNVRTSLDYARDRLGM